MISVLQAYPNVKDKGNNALGSGEIVRWVNLDVW